MSLITGEPHTATVATAVPTTALELREDEFRDADGPLPADPGATSTGILSDRLVAATRATPTRGRRGEAVALVAAPALAAAVPELLAAARAASPGSVEAIDAAGSLEEALARLDDALLEHRTVVLSAELEAHTLPLLLEQVDRAVVLLTEDDSQLRPPPGDGVELVLAGPGGWRGGGDVVRRVERRGAGLAAGDMAWLGRHLARTKLGLALGAGGAKGYAHVGRAAGARGGRLHDRLRGRQQHRRDRGRVRRRSGWTRPRSRPRCATPSPRTPWPRSSSSR